MLCNFIQTNNAQLFQMANCRNYVELSNMLQTGFWATEVEVFGADTLFSTRFRVFDMSYKSAVTEAEMSTPSACNPKQTGQSTISTRWVS